MKIKDQWLVNLGGLVILVLTYNDGYFLQKGLHHEFEPISSKEGNKLLKL